MVYSHTCTNPTFTIARRSISGNCDFCASSTHFSGEESDGSLRRVLRHSRYPLDSRWTWMQPKMTRKAVQWSSGLCYAVTVSEPSGDLCLNIALPHCHYLCGFALLLLLYPHRSRPQLFLSSLSSPGSPSLYVTLLKSDRCGVNLQPSLTPSLLRTSRAHCLRWG